MNTVTFDFPTDGMVIEVEAGYENDDGRAIVTDIECTLRDQDGRHVDFDADSFFIQERSLIDRRLTGKVIPLHDAIQHMAADKAQDEINTCLASEADRRADQHKEDRAQPC